jgi:hypothetical protein
VALFLVEAHHVEVAIYAEGAVGLLLGLHLQIQIISNYNPSYDGIILMEGLGMEGGKR